MGPLRVWVNRHGSFLFVGFLGYETTSMGEGRKKCDERSQLEELSRSSEQDIIPETAACSALTGPAFGLHATNSVSLTKTT